MKLEVFLKGADSTPDEDAAISSVRSQLAIPVSEESEKVVRALAACRLGVSSVSVAKLLGWREFEAFCALLFKAKGFEVTENLVLTKPRAQVDILARSSSVALAVDCKHWKRPAGQSALWKISANQSHRAKLLRQKMPRLEPLLSVILILANEDARFVYGTAVVPLFTLPSFLANLSEYEEYLEFI